MAKTVRRWLQRSDVKTLFISKGSYWENGYVESTGDKQRDELLNRKLFLSLEEARWVTDRWRLDNNHHRIHSALDYQTPAAFANGCVLPLRLRLRFQNTAELLNTDSLTHPGTNIGGGQLSYHSTYVGARRASSLSD